MCSHKAHCYRAEGVGVAQTQSGRGTSLWTCTVPGMWQWFFPFKKQQVPTGSAAHSHTTYSQFKSFWFLQSSTKRLRFLVTVKKLVGKLKETPSPSSALKSWLWKTSMTLSRDWFSWWSSSTRPSLTPLWFWCLWFSLARYCCRSSRARWASTT